MWDDVDQPIPQRRRIEPLLLDPLGITELRDYIAELRCEIERAEAAINQKSTHRSDADRLFKI